MISQMTEECSMEMSKLVVIGLKSLNTTAVENS